MEDAHILDPRDKYGLFGVYDGHADAACSAFIAERFPEHIAKAGPPLSDTTMEEIALAVDAEFAASGKPGGSTGTYLTAVPSSRKGCFDLHVANVGDSRILLGRGSTCIALTNDHKPNTDEEKARIEACGGFVTNNRVDGSLAVSRAFGDMDYKGNAAGGPLQQKVIAQPEQRHETAEPGDFVLLCCDGVFESNFTNEEVVEYVHQQLATTDDLGVICCRVCDQALERGSRDNVTCMLLRFEDGSKYGPPMQFYPGPYASPNHSGFCNAYQAMAEMAGLNTAAAIEARFDQVTTDLATRCAELQLTSADAKLNVSTLSDEDLRSVLAAQEVALPDTRDEQIRVCMDLQAQGAELVPEDVKLLRQELETFHGGPGDLKGAERTAFFQDRVIDDQTSGAAGGDGGDKTVDQATFERLQMLQQMGASGVPIPLLLQLLGGQGGQAGAPGGS
eukprot:NODE_865_length_1587_cov_52.655479_g854_i0.p1 GENE.NODE_865_length_1587_cov_52.655479_g854_i0~~NODE_865_length_1587_cov_52.655479_g854_i0.p1  ORF type:complete len:501 (+),score=87.75 NODE_865_length_1587_cov_52.655479_g854_i0:160-1503(+)